MNQIKELWIKCSQEGHDYRELACLNQSCKANRIYCHQCLRNGDHITHIKDQMNLNELIIFFHKIDKESEGLIKQFCLMFGEITELFTELIQGVKKKYQFSKERLVQLNAKQMNQALDQAIQYDEIKTGLFEEVKKCSDDMINQLIRKYAELKLHQNYKRIETIFHEPQKNLLILKQINKKRQKNYIKKVINDQFRIPIILKHQIKLIIYYEDDNYKEAIKQLDAALLINPKHLDSLQTKADCLKQLL